MHLSWKGYDFHLEGASLAGEGDTVELLRSR